MHRQDNVHKQYEFGYKLSVARTALSGITLGMKSFTGNFYDGNTLALAVDQVHRVRENAGSNRPKAAVLDRGDRGRKRIADTEVLITSSGSRGQTYDK